MAGIPKEKIVAKREELSLVESLQLEGIEKVFILHDLYAISLKNKIKQQVVEKIKGEEAK